MAQPVGHRTSDALGVIFIALAIVLIAGLALRNGGLVGDGLTSLLQTLVGRGAWVVPVVLGFAGLSLLAGRTDVQVGRVTVGTLLIFACTVGFFAQPLKGDYFDPAVLTQTGGYAGAVFAWLFGTLLGAAKPVGLVAMGLVGLVLCLDAPLHQILSRTAEQGRRKRVEARVQEATARPIKKAVVALPEFDDSPEQEVPGAAEPIATPESVPNVMRPKAAPKVTYAADRVETVQLNTETPRQGYDLPPLDLLAPPPAKSKRSKEEMERHIQTLEGTLEQFKIEANVVEVATGPTITRYELQLGPGIPVRRITNLADNIAMNLAASHVRVEAPIPGKAAIGVEVPNAHRSMVTLSEMVESPEFHSPDNKLCLALGKDVSGVSRYTDLTRMPHMLIGGATNSGKSICLATIIMSLIIRHTPKEVRLVMVDPKRVELTFFEGLPHLMCPVVKDVKEAPGVLRAVVREMDRRYDRFSEAGVRNIDGWNAKADPEDKLSYIVVIVDELADLMIQAAAEVETSICRLAQLARATGIHLVIATQRPSVDVITGTIKNNISSRTAFAVSSQIDSRTILDQAGAEKLIGKGDMLFLPIDQTKPTRIQGCYVSEKEIEAVCDFWRAQEKPHYVLNPVQIAIEERESEMREAQDADPFWEEAVRWVVERGEASTSMLQRKFSIGFQRASRLLDAMEEQGIVGKRDGPRPRQVLVDPMQVEVILGNQEYMTPVPDGETIDD
ncbi:MAG: hypothetical protein KIT11_10360 [Fimbriimonadaceae bacterium]|nr:hypothetical protein [Fimbriimonadaceae bacterium]QYK55724.1 MAG: hypothetical protein KF733_12030 [Fimbriimonadaceae bacterium]